MKKFIFTLVAGLILFYPQTPSLAEGCQNEHPLDSPYTRALCDPYTQYK